MIYFVNAQGRIEGGTTGTSPESINGITSVPAGCIAVYVNDNQYPELEGDQANYVIENGAPVYSPLPPSPPQSQEPTMEERVSSLEDAMTVIMGL